MTDRVLIFDTTLRDGEQSPGASLRADEKLEIARALSRLGVDVIEAGFPASSPDNFAAVRSIAETVGNEVASGGPNAEPPTICGLARAVQNDIERAFEAVRSARRPRIHTFIATSPIHRDYKLRMTREEVLERIKRMVSFAKTLCEDVEFSAEDAMRTELDFLCEVTELAIECGAKTVNLPDTVGYGTPQDLYDMISGVRNGARGAKDIILSVHCHDDLGMAVANSLSGVQAGARQVEGAINGIGERAGNASIEEVVMAIKVRRDRLQVDTGIDSTQLARVSRLVSSYTGMVVAPNKAIVGVNAFAHESGIHQDGLLKHGNTYEIMKPEDVGMSGTRLVLGKQSGRHALQKRLEELGVPQTDAELDATFTRMKALADRKKNVTDADILALVAAERNQDVAGFRLEALQIAAGTQGMPTATVRIRRVADEFISAAMKAAHDELQPSDAGRRAADGAASEAHKTGRKGDPEVITVAAVGTGPVHACFRAIDEVVQLPAELLEYSVHAVTEGIDALGEVTVRIRDVESGALYTGYAADTDVLVSSARAYLAALDRMGRERIAPPLAAQGTLTPEQARGSLAPTAAE